MEAISIRLTREALSDISSSPHRVQVWTINDGSSHPTGFWAISEIGVDRVMFSADYPYNARRLFRSDRDA